MFKNKDERLVERFLPLKETNLDAIVEVGFKGLDRTKREEYAKVFGVKPMVVGPRVRNLHTWFARRPCSTARVLTLSSIAKADANYNDFLNAVGVGKGIHSVSRKQGAGLLFYAKPEKASVDRVIDETVKLNGATILDPMAGGGSIPLESARLGFSTVAVDYNPVAYLILRATAEFPAKYADAGLFEATVQASKELMSKARERLERFYGQDAKRYIFARGIRCPFCSGLIPIQAVEPAITKVDRFKKRFIKITYDKARKSFGVETTDKPVASGTILKRGDNVKCPYDGCGKWFQLRGKAKAETTAFDSWFKEHAQMMETVVEGFAPITSEFEDKLFSLHIPLVKQCGGTFHAIWDDVAERRKFADSIHTLSNDLLNLQNYIPMDEISPSNVWASTARSKGLNKWYMLFSPRQLLMITELSRCVAEIGQELVEKNGEFGAAVTTYLALALDKIVDYNTLATSWQGTGFKTGIAHTLRGESTIDFRKEYCEMGFSPPELSLGWALETEIAESGKLNKTAGGVLPVLQYLCASFRGLRAGNNVSVFMGDATELSSFLATKSVDVVNVDPPYYEQVIYSDKSEMFWTILRRSLAPVLELLFRSNLKLTNWSWTTPTVPREKEVVTYDKQNGDGRFAKLFKNFTDEVSKVLKDDGVLTLWFTHPTAEAWRTVSNSLYDNNFVVPKVWPLQTEMKTRYKKQVNIVAQEMTLVIVGRKYPRKKLLEISPQDIRGSIMENPAFTNTVAETVEDTRKIIIESNASPADTAALMFGTALSVASKFELPIGATFSDVYDAAITAVISRFVRPLLSKVLIETGPIKLDQPTSEKVTKSISQSMLLDPASRSYLTLWLLSRVDLATGKIRQETLGLHFDLVQTVGKLCGFGLDNLKLYGLVSEKTIDKSGRAYYPQFLEMLTLPGGKALPDKIKEVAPGVATILARSAMTESGDPTARAKTIRAKMSMASDRELASNAALAIMLLETTSDEDLGFRAADKTKISGYLPGMDESEAARIVRELAIKTLTQLIF